MTLPSLISLQAVDLQLRRLRADLADLPRRLTTAQASLAGAQKTLATETKSLADEEALRRRQELDVAAHRIKMERLAGQLDAATSAAQITALEHQLEFTRAAISTLEDEELASMERTEMLEAALPAQQTAQTNAAAGLERVKATSAETTAQHGAAVLSLEAERAKLRNELFNPPADWPETTPAAPAALATYERVAKSKGTGLAEAIPDASGGGQCSACRMRIRPQRWQDIASREHMNEIYSCESCGRLLFYDTRRNAPGAAPEIDRLQAALAAEPVKRLPA